MKTVMIDHPDHGNLHHRERPKSLRSLIELARKAHPVDNL